MIDFDKTYGFMPGCSLPSYSPEAVVKTVEWLGTQFPKFATVLKCCGKPTKSIGQHDLFEKRFHELEKDFHDVNVDVVVSACQNCYLLVKGNSRFETKSLWELMPKLGMPEGTRGKGKGSDIVFSIHDSCPTRDEPAIHDGIRWILKELGYKFKDSEHSRENTRCCGFGGMIVPANPDLAKRVMQRRLETLETPDVVAYCAACRSSLLQVEGRSWHILDLLWGPPVQKGDTPPPDVLANPVKSWINRYKSKAGIKKVV